MIPPVSIWQQTNSGQWPGLDCADTVRQAESALRREAKAIIRLKTYDSNRTNNWHRHPLPWSLRRHDHHHQDGSTFQDRRENQRMV